MAKVRDVSIILKCVADSTLRMH